MTGRAAIWSARNLLGVLSSNSNLLYSFTWGTDLSGTEQGAGGIGGLISMRVHSGTMAGTYFYVFDGNGNVTMLLNAADGSIAAQYEYGPFGETLRASGPLAVINPFRFSTRFQDDETGSVYYGYRYYDSSAGRWLSRDPIEERGGKNLYGFAKDSAVNCIDPLGHSVNDPPNCNSATYCCDWKTTLQGLTILTERWLHAANYLDANGVALDPHDVTGVSCVQSANHILAFMAPVPKCWKCYIQRRMWNYNPLNGDENSIRCDSLISNYSIVFDWWYEKYEGYKAYYPIPKFRYNLKFPFDLGLPPNGWWTKDDPAPADDCVNKSRIPPERSDELKALLPPYGQSGL